MKTKELITQTFVQLLDITPFDRITTQMILDKSGVSRSTFYRCFKQNASQPGFRTDSAYAEKCYAALPRLIAAGQAGFLFLKAADCAWEAFFWRKL